MVSTRVLKVVFVVMMALAAVALMLLLLADRAGAEAGSVRWALESEPDIRLVDGYWLVDRVDGLERRCYTEPVVEGAWVVSCERGNRVRVSGADEAFDEDALQLPYPNPGAGCIDLWRWLGWCE